VPEILRNLTPDRLVTRCELVCFPYAGGGTRVFRAWPQYLTRLVNISVVQFAGREARMAQEPETDPERVIGMLTEAIAPLAASKGLVLFGHSLGAVLAARTAQELLGGKGATEAVLFVSGRRAPWSARPPLDDHELSDDDYLALLASMGRLQPELARNAEFARLMLPALKADLRLSAVGREIRERAVSMPVIGLYGQEDEGAPLSSVREWSRFTTGSFRCEGINGDHFFLEPGIRYVTALVDAAARSLIRF
jgi:medium-chain acyl-[acyl-carrier-protein] hydrolase